MEAIEYPVMSYEADAENSCLNVQLGNGAIVNFIKAHESEVSSTCMAALKETGV